MELIQTQTDMHYYVMTEKMKVLAGTHTQDYGLACDIATQLVHRQWKTQKERRAIVSAYVVACITAIKKET